MRYRKWKKCFIYANHLPLTIVYHLPFTAVIINEPRWTRPVLSESHPYGVAVPVSYRARLFSMDERWQLWMRTQHSGKRHWDCQERERERERERETLWRIDRRECRCIESPHPPTPQNFVRGRGVFPRHTLSSRRHRSPAAISPSTHSNSLSFSSSCQLIALAHLML